MHIVKLSMENRSKELGLGDLYLDRIKSDLDRAVIFVMLFKDRYETEGMRGRQATAAGAGIQHYISAAIKSVDWFELHIVTSARAAGRMTCDELRGHKKEANSHATLLISKDMLSAGNGVI